MDYLEKLTKELLEKDINPMDNSSNSSNNSNSRKNILIVDDNEDSLFLLEMILKKEGYNLFLARDGMEAVNIYKKEYKEDTPIEIIFMDIRMPNMNGIEATKLIRKFEKENHIIPCKIIMLTAYTDYEKKGVEAGADEVLLKPIRRENILNEIKYY